MADARPVALAITRAHPITAAVIALCAYEVLADVVNDLLDADLVPSMRGGLERFSWLRIGRRMVPRWSPQGTVIAVGVVGGALARTRSRARDANLQPSKR
jgi:hypothetical protein